MAEPRAKGESRATPNFTANHRIEFADTDAAGVVHFATYFRLMEETEHAFYRSLGGVGFEEMEDGQMRGMPRVSATCDYMTPLRYGDEVDVSLTVRRIGERSISYDFDFWLYDKLLSNNNLRNKMSPTRTSRGEPELAARGSMTVVHVRGNAWGDFGSVPLPEFLREGAKMAPPPESTD